MSDDMDWDRMDSPLFNEQKIFAEMGIDELPDGSTNFILCDQQRLVMEVLEEADAGFNRALLRKQIDCRPRTHHCFVSYVVRIPDREWKLLLPEGCIVDELYRLILPESVTDRLYEICTSVFEEHQH